MPGPNQVGSTAQLRNSLNTIISRFDTLRDYSGCMRPLMTELPLKEHTGRSVVRTNYGRVLAQSLTDGMDMQQQQDLSDASTTYTPNEVGVQVILLKTTNRRSADTDLEGRTAQIMENAYSLKEDQDACSIATSFTTQMGSSTTVLGVGHATAAETKLRIGNSLTTPEPVVGDIYFVAHPCSLHAVAMRLVPLTDVPTGTNAYSVTGNGVTVGPGKDGEGLSEDIIKMGRQAIKMLGGMKVYQDANVTAGANSGFHSIAFGRDGAVFCPEWEPEMDPEPDKSLRGFELNMVGSYGTGVYRPAALGLDMFFDATIPTA